MDRSWIKANIRSKTFKDGVQYFIDFARARSIRGIIACPCLKCCLCKRLTVDAAHVDILQYGFLPGYKTWTIHGENSIPSQLSHPNPSIVHETSVGEDDIRGLVRDALGVSSLPLNNPHESDSRLEGNINESNEEPGQSSKDKDIPYERLLEECDKELYPGCKYKVVLFQCDWVDIRPSRGLKKDKYRFPLVNFSRPLVHTGEKLSDDPFIISSQAKQVFHIDDIRDVGWSHVIQTKPRDIYDMGSDENKDEFESYTQCMPCTIPLLDDVNEAPSWHRTNIEIDSDDE
ncbi:tetratricopeptide-like helical domain, DYW domain protein [Tanacetum coccineum]